MRKEKNRSAGCFSAEFGVLLYYAFLKKRMQKTHTQRVISHVLLASSSSTTSKQYNCSSKAL